MSTETERRPDASMSLINELLHRPLDPGYAAATERRRRGGRPEPQRPTTPLALATVLVIGLVLGISATTLNARQTERSSARVELLAQIDARQERVEANTARVRELQDEVAVAQEQVLLDSSGQTPGLTSQLLASVGAVGVQGPGLVITIDDAPSDPSAAPGAQDEGKVLSRDLQIVVNALWAAEAEAIDVGGQRLTSRSAIRFAGEAILVNYRPLPRPYIVRAIGDPDRLAADFAAGDGGVYLKALSDNFGIRADVVAEEEITMRSASALRVENAEPRRPEVGTP
jgi:uncharacterized protein YlxW (UPF0749 family)